MTRQSQPSPGPSWCVLPEPDHSTTSTPSSHLSSSPSPRDMPNVLGTSIRQREKHAIVEGSPNINRKSARGIANCKASSSISNSSAPAQSENTASQETSILISHARPRPRHNWFRIPTRNATPGPSTQRPPSGRSFPGSASASAVQRRTGSIAVGSSQSSISAPLYSRICASRANRHDLHYMRGKKRMVSEHSSPDISDSESSDWSPPPALSQSSPKPRSVPKSVVPRKRIRAINDSPRQIGTKRPKGPAPDEVIEISWSSEEERDRQRQLTARTPIRRKAMSNITSVKSGLAARQMIIDLCSDEETEPTNPRLPLSTATSLAESRLQPLDSVTHYVAPEPSSNQITSSPAFLRIDSHGEIQVVTSVTAQENVVHPTERVPISLVPMDYSSDPTNTLTRQRESSLPPSWTDTQNKSKSKAPPPPPDPAQLSSPPYTPPGVQVDILTTPPQWVSPRPQDIITFRQSPHKRFSPPVNAHIQDDVLASFACTDIEFAPPLLKQTPTYHESPIPSDTSAPLSPPVLPLPGTPEILTPGSGTNSLSVISDVRDHMRMRVPSGIPEACLPLIPMISHIVATKPQSIETKPPPPAEADSQTQDNSLPLEDDPVVLKIALLLPGIVEDVKTWHTEEVCNVGLAVKDSPDDRQVQFYNSFPSPSPLSHLTLELTQSSEALHSYSGQPRSPSVHIASLPDFSVYNLDTTVTDSSILDETSDEYLLTQCFAYPEGDWD